MVFYYIYHNIIIFGNIVAGIGDVVYLKVRGEEKGISIAPSQTSILTPTP
ncbi:MAG: hypothetical protein HC898_06795 [Phycisphaerales bacterium]|nr:hypothetical protein [Phycisphaerales bacterium]